ncbi:hypothetical protein GLOTRDRAFT_95968 [Gloeophyllum trabeum ATCC 11539]|uniref:Phosphatidylglycerol/phosphatidylinositol transfer protein n=1 Tax=Gloeophyllum trabeum (strain ATCC 11539 / FP-39264 / Madison 617) TaxID=670483 RepID=S7PXY2_GLOTA|nr:uncharacterized protein GLOTRDRAFT_95968 [Gloeophyllum trabeum ATCC 11539]EPQ52378.1 hypothetical protein GLOTRDRAFT_95968 [Gloeophyllum trabeum ATCC 11539]
MRLALVLASLVAAAFGQSIEIGAPSPGTTVSAGSNITISVFKPNSLTGSTEVGLVLALNPCRNNTCYAPTEVLGNVLYSGAWQPDYSQPAGALPPHQNFTVQVPEGLESGPAVLSASHMVLIGAGPAPDMECVNITVNVA